jgi:hypothetical protein
VKVRVGGLLILLLHSYFFETMYIGDKGLAQVSRVAPLEFKASLFPRNVTRFSPVGDPNFGHSLCAIGTARDTDKNLGEVLSAQGKEMREIRSNIAALSTQMAAINHLI